MTNIAVEVVAEADGAAAARRSASEQRRPGRLTPNGATETFSATRPAMPKLQKSRRAFAKVPKATPRPKRPALHP